MRYEHGRERTGDEHAIIRGRILRDAIAPVEKHHEERNHHHRTDKTKLFADDREDEIGLCFRKILKLLVGITQAHTEEPA